MPGEEIQSGKSVFRHIQDAGIAKWSRYGNVQKNFCHMLIACNAHKKHLEPPEIIAGSISPAKDLKPAALSTVDSIIFMSASAQSEG